MYSTEAWVIYQGPADKRSPERATLTLEPYTIPALGTHDVLCEPIYGCWEGNMGHAISRRPIDVCRERKEEKVVLGNSGVVRVLKTGSEVTGVREGDMCVVFGASITDEFGYMKKALAFDCPGTMGVLAKQTKLHEKNLIRIPRPTRYSLKQWAAFSLRYITAWANWRVAYGCWRVQMSEEDQAVPYVWGWGGGSTLAELQLAERQGAKAAMIASNDTRLKMIQSLNIEPIDRRPFEALSFDEKRFGKDEPYTKAYSAAESAFLKLVKERTDGRGVSIFLDYIGTPVLRATLRALARQGVIATAGWKHGMVSTSMRAIECIERHTHVHTHYARYSEGVDAVAAGERLDWMPPLDESEKIYEWDEIPMLDRDYQAGSIESYFPLFRVNPI